MKKTVTKRIKVTNICDIICDHCGKSCYDAQKINFEFSILHAEWGYLSHKDGDSWEYHLCEDCSDKVLEFIKTPNSNIIK